MTINSSGNGEAQHPGYYLPIFQQQMHKNCTLGFMTPSVMPKGEGGNLFQSSQPPSMEATPTNYLLGNTNSNGMF